MLKKEIHREMFTGLLQLQSSYVNVSEQLTKQYHLLIPKNEAEVERLGALEQQIQVAKTNNGKIEEIKYWTSIALLTDGALITDDELMGAILSSEELIRVAQQESQSEEPDIITWAKDKLAILERVNRALYDVMDHKMHRKEELGEITLQ